MTTISQEQIAELRLWVRIVTPPWEMSFEEIDAMSIEDMIHLKGIWKYAKNVSKSTLKRRSRKFGHNQAKPKPKPVIASNRKQNRPSKPAFQPVQTKLVQTVTGEMIGVPDWLA